MITECRISQPAGSSTELRAHGVRPMTRRCPDPIAGRIFGAVFSVVAALFISGTSGAYADEFITFRPTQTNCPKCQPLVERYNAILGEIDTEIAEYRALQQKLRLIDETIQEKKARARELEKEHSDLFFDSMRRRDVSLHDPMLRENRQRRLTIDDETETLEAEIGALESERQEQAEAVDAQKARVQTTQGQALNLYRDITDCESTCSPEELKPADEVSPLPPVDGNVGLAGDVIAEATTKCPACQPLADEINRTIGRLKAARDERAKVAADLRSAEDRLRQSEAAERDLRKQFEETLLKQIEARASGGDLTALGRQLTDLSFRISDIDDTQFNIFKETEALLDRAGQIDQAIADMIAQMTALRAALADCEKTCQPPAGSEPPRTDPGQPGGGVAAPDPDGFVTTDCPPCAQLASLINDMVGSLKTLRRNLAAVKARLAAIPAEQDALDAEARAALDAYGAKVLQIAEARKQGKDLTGLQQESADLSDAYTALQEKIFDLFREKDDLDQRVKDLARQIADLEAQLRQKREELKECEKQCQPPAGPPPMVDPGQPGGGVALPDPDGFVSTDCPPCAHLASLINDIIGSLKTLKSDLAAAEAELAALPGQQDALEAESKAALDAYGAKVLEIATARRQGQDLTALNKESAELSEAYTDLQDKIADLFIKQDELKAKVEDLKQQIADLEAQLAQKREELKECEKQCQPPAGPPPMADPGQPGSGVALPDPDGFVSTDCPPCAHLASLINDIIGSLRTLKRDLAAAQAELAALPGEQEALEAESRAALDAYGAKVLEIAAAREAGTDLSALQEESAGLSDAYNDLQEKLFEHFVKKDALADKVADLARQIADLEAQLAQKREELKECEKQCQPPAGPPPMADPGQPGGGVALTDPNGFVATDCPPCAQLASLINDIVGTLRTLTRDLAVAQAELAALPDQQDALDAESRAALDAYGDKVLEIAAGRQQGKDLTALQRESAELSKEYTDLQERIFDLFVKKDGLEAKVADLANRIADLEAQLQQKRDELKECEKRCQPPVNAPPVGDPGQQGGGVAVPDPDGFVSTDCPPCAQLASLINDLIGSLRTLNRDLATARAELAAAGLTIDQKSAEEEQLSKAFESAILRRREVQAQGGSTAALDKQVTDIAFEIGDMQEEISDLFTKKDELEARTGDLTTQIADIEATLPARRAELEQCEQQCQARTEQPVVHQGETETAMTPADLAVAKSQPEQCRLGRACTFTLGVANRGMGPYTGPVFLMDRMKTPVRIGSIQQGDWFCSGGGGGVIVCHANLDGLAPRAEAGVRLGIGLAGRMPQSARENCGNLIQPSRTAQGEAARDTIRVVQLGLNRLGIDAGPADGLPGLKTSTAIASFFQQVGKDDKAAEASMDTVAEMLFGESVFTTVVQAPANSEQCIAIDIREPPSSPVRRPPPVRDVPERSSPQIPYQFGIGIGIGIGRELDRDRNRNRNRHHENDRD
jgi:chromosome segregation ATPase